MPMPSHLERRDGSLAIDGGFHVAVCGMRNAALDKAVSRFAAQLASQTGLFLPLATAGADCSRATLTIDTQRVVTLPALGDDESYTLDVTPDAAHLSAPSSTGVLRGLATFQQLVQPAQAGFAAPAVSIEDRPRFPWRGLMLDVARHWMPVEVLERNMDAMAAVKLNVFHWHLSDDQGFRVESHAFPKLQADGSDGHYYTQEQIRQVVSYARDRGIRVIPEFDIPGHATSWVTGYPELASGPGPFQIERGFGVFAPTMDPTRETTYQFLDRFIGEMTRLFPDPYFHIGGDEVLDTEWRANAGIQKFMREHSMDTSEKLHEYFNRRVGAILKRHGRTMIGWDEILTPGLSKDAVIQSWRGQEALAKAARAGYRGLLSFGYYLDHMRPAYFHYGNDPLGSESNLNGTDAARILGGEACMWTEYVSPETVDSRLWPRLAAIAERLWSPATVADPDDMYTRLDHISEWLQWTGVKHLSAQKPMLDRIAGYRSDGDLKVLADAVSASGIADRYPSRKYTALEPLNRLVDAAVSESVRVRHLKDDARTVLAGPGADPAASARLRDAFHAWQETPMKIAPLASENILAAETVPVAAKLARLGDAGSQALDFIEKHQAPPAGWVDAQRPIVESALQLTAEVRVSAADVVRILLDALGGPQR